MLLLSVDAASVASSIAIGWLLWALPVHGQPIQLYLVPMTAAIPGWWLGSFAAGLYQRATLGPIETLRRTTVVASLLYLGMLGATFALKLPHTYSRATVAMAWGLTVVMLPVGRTLVGSLFSRATILREPAVALRVVLHPDLIRGLRREGIEPIQADPSVDTKSVYRTAILDEATARNVPAGFSRLLVIPDDTAAHWVLGAVARPVGTQLVLHMTNASAEPLNRLAKRLLDVVLSAVLLAVAAPVIGILALVIVATDRRRPFFAQTRAGRNGRQIRVLKLRSMRGDAERVLEQHLSTNASAAAEWNRTFKLERDPRVLPLVGQFLRRYSLDELPQLWNVLKGEMSLVGPRPFPDYHLQRLPRDFLALRQTVRPGITGLWQVTVRSEGSLEDQQRLDTFYIRNWSLWMDIWILGRTLGAVLSGRGAY